MPVTSKIDSDSESEQETEPGMKPKLELKSETKEYIHYLPPLPKLISNTTPRSDKSCKTSQSQSEINDREIIVANDIMKEKSMLLNLKEMIYDKQINQFF